MFCNYIFSTIAIYFKNIERYVWSDELYGGEHFDEVNDLWKLESFAFLVIEVFKGWINFELFMLCWSFKVLCIIISLTWFIEFQDDMERSFRIGINFRYFSFFSCYWIVDVMWQCYICSIFLHGKTKNTLWLWKYWGYHSTCENVHAYIWVMMF
jgi:hypothetical protein